MTHTPGPWVALQGCDDDKTRWTVHQNQDKKRQWHIATIENGAPGDTLDTEAANARLIAAAPDLLEALKMLRHSDGCFCDASFSMGGCHPSHTKECQQAQCAIAKAEGRS